MPWLAPAKNKTPAYVLVYCLVRGKGAFFLVVGVELKHGWIIAQVAQTVATVLICRAEGWVWLSGLITFYKTGLSSTAYTKTQHLRVFGICSIQKSTPVKLRRPT
jgi:hypothetical protein